ncbi:DUF1851 domain-containing protein [Xanthomonas cerealis pv. cerealis]|uniref:DUF1851 domain-containing protein n=1 Tax=Xanthomonas cerealis pv. cerealis TaxID=152263 RepID=A0A514EFN1_9XANT|nr:GAD-like domain-containing protein [Xanthomonas translucens]QDI04825.1 DUF1851 domain-containing protein [Xanthomonas translucens pv. cerealis]
MRDEDFEVLIDEFGEAFHHEAVAQDAIDCWVGRVPNYLLQQWSAEGWNGYAKGLFWLVNPGDYEEIAEAWLADTPLPKVDVFHVIARSAFGDLYLCGERTGSSVSVSPALNMIFATPKGLKPKNEKQKDISVKSLLLSSKKDFDFKDQNDEPLFSRAAAKLGELAPDEVYGFEPALVAGGKAHIDSLRRMKLDPHLTILRQFASPQSASESLDIDKVLDA